MTDLTVLMSTIEAIRPASDQTRREATAAMADKVKPLGSLGLLEEVAIRIAALRGRVDLPDPTPAVVVCAADHGIAREGVSAFPQAVTGLMLTAFGTGGAAVAVLSRAAGARLVVADLGVIDPPVVPGVLDLSIRPGTANSVDGPAMTPAEATAALRQGIDLAHELVDDGVDLIALGEMGIGNTTTASALTAALLGLDAAATCGRGTGLDDEQVAHKVSVVDQVLARHASVSDDPLAVLAAMGGLEVAALAGVVLGAAERKVPVLVDGFITGAAALVAARLAPACTDAMVAAHLSPEPGHALQLAALGLRPLLDLQMRLGEGSGAALAINVVRSSIAVLTEMATFASLGLDQTSPVT
ncbi:nicotinate-nucleotide--dimethylbenzimidazole phosphoribosyltransferase [Nocardioides piscis]|uniref:Nicotinate-nucleotide--dimethylbenzimidazole phosphoribosyltransferase n=1 Tax=Nocardioides piscis TaxID=2714938 RepID=A0A6G7YIE7_9ACTN|nr:nicotinate-nucleotide--dimethylbenzimidazole phosphoribosyltransferase [Nocardioides piscis]QIK76448.1 nicotinate-nucleotide--dimethylbenzimidazole phosphoribosyltransferase [Nocardioides piscis]